MNGCENLYLHDAFDQNILFKKLYTALHKHGIARTGTPKSAGSEHAGFVCVRRCPKINQRAEVVVPVWLYVAIAHAIFCTIFFIIFSVPQPTGICFLIIKEGVRNSK